MRARQSSNLRRLLLALAGVALLLAVSAVAGDPLGLRVDKRHRGTRLTSKPRLVFMTGVLQHARAGSWQLDNGLQLQMSPDVEWRDETTGGITHPSAGRLVMLSGQKYGGTMLVRQGTVLSRERQIQATQAKPVTEPDQPERRLPQ